MHSIVTLYRWYTTNSYFSLMAVTPCVYRLVLQSCPALCDPWTVARQAPLPMGFSRQECWSGLPFPTLRVLPGRGLNLSLLHCQAASLSLSHRGSPFVYTHTHTHNIFFIHSTVDGNLGCSHCKCCCCEHWST